MNRMESHIVLPFLLAALLSGCDNRVASPPATPQAQAQTWNLTEDQMMRTGAKGDPATYVANKAMTLDLNGDGTNDSVIMQNNVLFWKRSGTGQDASLLTVTFPVNAYTLRVPPNGTNVALYVYDSGNFEHCALNLGNSPDGTPMFGTLEASK